MARDELTATLLLAPKLNMSTASCMPSLSPVSTSDCDCDCDCDDDASSCNSATTLELELALLSVVVVEDARMQSRPQRTRLWKE
jgi:hypothetical protein